MESLRLPRTGDAFTVRASLFEYTSGAGAGRHTLVQRSQRLLYRDRTCPRTEGFLFPFNTPRAAIKSIVSVIGVSLNPLDVNSG